MLSHKPQVRMMNQPRPAQSMSALVLSGGQSRRMQAGDKGLMKLAGKPMIQYLLDSLSQHINQILISTNSSDPEYASFGYPLVSDILPGSLGPLAGIHAGLHTCNTQFLLITPCDCPFLTTTLSERLAQAIEENNTLIAVAHDGERMQNTFALINIALTDSLSLYLQRGGRKLNTWFKEQNAIEVNCSDHLADFTNINTLADLQDAERILATS